MFMMGVSYTLGVIIKYHEMTDYILHIIISYCLIQK